MSAPRNFMRFPLYNTPRPCGVPRPGKQGFPVAVYDTIKAMARALVPRGFDTARPHIDPEETAERLEAFGAVAKRGVGVGVHAAAMTKTNTETEKVCPSG